MKTTAIFLFMLQCGFAYGQSFVNLNFESAVIPHGTAVGSYVSTNSAIPGWSSIYSQLSVGVVNEPEPLVVYDLLSLGGPAVSIMDTNAGLGFSPISGRYSLYLFGATSQASETISQTGLIPSTANSLQMLIGNYNIFNTYHPPGDFNVSLNGQTITMMPIANSPTYTTYAGNISPFANQIATLNITALAVQSGPGPNAVLIDNIFFSPSSIPEPGVLALSALGGLFFARRRWNKK